MIVLPHKIISNLQKHPLLRSLFTTHIGYFPKAEYHYRERNEGISEYVLIYCIEGEGWYEIEDERFEVRPNEFFILPAESPHRYSADIESPWSIYWVHFTGTQAPGFIHSFNSQHKTIHEKVSPLSERIELIEEIYKTLERGYSTDNIGYANCCLWHLLGSFCYQPAFESKKSGIADDTIENSIQLMKNNVDQNLKLKELAEHASFSVSHYSTLFKKKTGFAPIEYFIHLKIQKACQFLDLTSLNVYEIAEALGYSDPHYFSRLFQNIMGVSPTAFRDEKRG